MASVGGTQRVVASAGGGTLAQASVALQPVAAKLERPPSSLPEVVYQETARFS